MLFGLRIHGVALDQIDRLVVISILAVLVTLTFTVNFFTDVLLPVLLDNLIQSFILDVDFIKDFVGPGISDFIQFGQSLLLLLEFDVVALIFEQVFDVGKGTRRDIDVVIVHYIDVVTLELVSFDLDEVGTVARRCLAIGDVNDTGIELHLSCLLGSLGEFLLNESLPFLLQVFVSQSTGGVISQDNVEVVEIFDVHLHRIHDIEIAPGLPNITRWVRDGTLSRKNLGHVIVLHVGQCLTIVFGAPAAQIMEVINDLIDLTMHNHQVDLAHGLAGV